MMLNLRGGGVYHCRLNMGELPLFDPEARHPKSSDDLSRFLLAANAVKFFLIKSRLYKFRFDQSFIVRNLCYFCKW